MRRFAAWANGLVPPSVVEEDEVVRARVFVRGWLVSIPFSFVSLLISASSHMWSQVALVVPVLVAGPLMLWRLSRTGRFEALTHASLGLVTLAFGTAAVAQAPGDYTSLGFLIVMPLLGSFVLGPRGGVVWFVVPLVWGLVVLGLLERGVVMPFRDEAPFLSHATNWVFSMVLTWVFARSYDEQRMRSHHRVAQADRAKSAFLATVSHEIRTPMNGVLGMTEVLLREPLTASQRERLDVIARSGRLLVSLINDVLDFTKIEAGRLSLSATDFALAPVLADVCSLHASLAGQSAVSLESSVGPDVPPVGVGDASRLSQVLGNLLNNAMKFTERGTVSLRVSRQPCPTDGQARLRFEVCDTGVGIAPDVLPRLFTAFVQGDSSTTRRYGGTGLGLSLCQQLVGFMGGRIEVESEVGQGTRFWFELQLPIGQARTTSMPDGLPVPAFGGARVLVVDDNPINLRVAQALVEKAGFLVDTAVDGAKALEAVQVQHYALVLMDCHMPTMDGFEATARIRALGGDAGQTPIVALTASARQEDLEACRKVGMNDWLAKPVTFAALVEMLERTRRPATPLPQRPSA